MLEGRGFAKTLAFFENAARISDLTDNFSASSAIHAANYAFSYL